MSHGPHMGPSNAIFYDDCEDCTHKALDPIAHLDNNHMRALWFRMLRTEFSYGEAPRYETDNEAIAGKQLYRTALFLERFMGVDPREALTP